MKTGCVQEATSLARQAVADLYKNGMFVGHSDTTIYEAVDGVGILIDALMALPPSDAPTVRHT